MRVLIACEYSGVVRDAFRAAGHDAMSCDLLPTETPGPHYMGDITNLLDGWMPVRYSADCDPCPGPTQDGMEYKQTEDGLFARPEDRPHWDLMIAHPPCIYLTCSAEWAYKERGQINKNLDPAKLYGAARDAARDEAANFFMRLVNAPIDRIAIENPVGVMSTRYRKPDQFIQPYEYGHDASKRTGLWMKGLPPLVPTNYVEPRLVGGLKRWANQTDSGQNCESPGPDRWKIRSTTWQGWADAMADRWAA